MNALQAFDFEDVPVRTIVRDGAPWFVLADVCRVLDIANPTMAAARLDEDECSLVNTLNSADGIRGRGNPNLNVVNESGLYALIFTSRKEVAKRFRKWVTSIVLPTLRETGSFTFGGEDDPDWPVSADGKLWGVAVSKVNAAARMIGVVNRIYGPEAARSLYQREKGLPPLLGFSGPELVSDPGSNPMGCLTHLMRQATTKGSVGSRLALAFADKPSAASLKMECGVAAMPNAEGGPAIAIASAHPFLARAFAESQWCGAWRHALVNLAGARFARRLDAVLVPRDLAEGVKVAN